MVLKGYVPVGLYRWQIKLTTGTSSESKTGPPVREGQIVHLQHLSVTDKTTQNKMMRVGWQDEAGNKHFIKARQGSAVSSVWMNGSNYLIESEMALGEIDSPSDGDEVHMVGSGVIYEKAED